jgi:hypothetical protein
MQVQALTREDRLAQSTAPRCVSRGAFLGLLKLKALLRVKQADSESLFFPVKQE